MESATQGFGGAPKVIHTTIFSEGAGREQYTEIPDLAGELEKLLKVLHKHSIHCKSLKQLLLSRGGSRLLNEYSKHVKSIIHK